MPYYEFQCPAGCRFDYYLRIAEHATARIACTPHLREAYQIITAPLFVLAQPDCAYTSPIDDRPITSWAARQEDLKRHNCRPYDPMMKQDTERGIQAREAALEAKIDASVEEAIEKMPTATRGKLWSELTDQGLEAQIERRTPRA